MRFSVLKFRLAHHVCDFQVVSLSRIAGQWTMVAWSDNKVLLQRSPCSWALTATPNTRGVVKSRDARDMLVIRLALDSANGVQNRSKIDSKDRIRTVPQVWIGVLLAHAHSMFLHTICTENVLCACAIVEIFGRATCNLL